jgi:hypothetical protein
MPPTPPMSHNSPLPDRNEIHPTPIHRLGLRPGGHKDFEVFPMGSLTIRPFPVLPPSSAKVLAPAKST